MRCVGCPPHDAGTGLRWHWGDRFPVATAVWYMRLGVPSRGVHAIFFCVVCAASDLIEKVRLFLSCHTYDLVDREYNCKFLLFFRFIKNFY